MPGRSGGSADGRKDAGQRRGSHPQQPESQQEDGAVVASQSLRARPGGRSGVGGQCCEMERHDEEFQRQRRDAGQRQFKQGRGRPPDRLSRVAISRAAAERRRRSRFDDL